jgi:hypothetical protein
MRILPACVAGVVLAVGCLMGCKGKNPVSAKPEPRATWMDPRVWTASDGRTLEGALVARMGEDGVVRRAVDGVFLRLPPRFLNSDNLSFLNNAFQSGSIPTTLPNLWYVRTKLTIPGGEAWMAPDATAAIGPRIAKSETGYWILMSELDGSGAKWARVDNHSYSRVRSDVLLPRSELATQMNGSGAFLDEVGCPRNDLYVIDARYGLTSRRINVTRAMMGHLAAGSLPVTVSHALFDLPPHGPDVWDLTITWQRSNGSAFTRVIRDGSILAWPEVN